MPPVNDSRGTGGIAASSRRDDRSGLLDIRALSSMIDAQRAGPTASASSVALPTFTNPWTTEHLLPPPKAPASTTPRPVAPADNRLLYAMIGALSLAVASLGAYVVLRPPPTPPLRSAEASVAPPILDDEREEKAEGEREDREDREKKAEAEAEAEEKAKPDEAEKADAEQEDQEPESVRPRPRPRPRPKPEATPKPKPPPKDDGPIPVECIIDPGKCTKSGRPRKGDDTPPPSTKGLPATPSSSQIRSAMDSVKPQAKACGDRHGAKAGDKVRVKLSAKGSTGRITSAKPLDEHAGTALGRCVAQALSKAELPRFSKPQAGIVYAIRM